MRPADDRAAWKVVVEHAPAKTEGQAREVIKTWVKNGVLVRYDYDNPVTRKSVKGLRVDPRKKPSQAKRPPMTESSTKTAPPVVPFGKYKGQFLMGSVCAITLISMAHLWRKPILRHYQKVP